MPRRVLQRPHRSLRVGAHGSALAAPQAPGPPPVPGGPHLDRQGVPATPDVRLLPRQRHSPLSEWAVLPGANPSGPAAGAYHPNGLDRKTSKNPPQGEVRSAPVRWGILGRGDLTFARYYVPPAGGSLGRGLGNWTGAKPTGKPGGLRRGDDQGARLNVDGIVVPRRGRPHTPNGWSLPSPNGGFGRDGHML